VVSIVIVSHNHLLAEGLKQLAMEMSRDSVKIATAGGVDEARMGTNAERIYEAIQEVYTPDGVLILFDLGGALFSTQVALEMLAPEQQRKVKLSGAPIVEGTLVAVIEASLGHDLETVNAAAEAAQHVEKILL
jgi:dihydroxyacetone kinase phosphotransfer subunit